MDATEEDEEMSVIMSGYCMPSLSDMSSDSLLSQSQYAKVIFHDLLPMYPTDADIWCRYSVTSGVDIRHGDRVALYRVGWNHIQDHVHFEVAPVPSVHPGPHTQLQVLFRAENLPKDKSEFYQLCYVSVDGAVCGASVPFQFQCVGEGELCEVEGEGGLLEVRSCTAVGLNQLRKATQEIEELRGELEEAKGELEEAKVELEGVKGQLEGVKSELEGVKGELEQVKGELANKTEHLAQGRLAAGTMGGELREANAKLEELKGELEAVKGELANKADLLAGGRLAERKLRGELDQFKINAEQLGAAIVKLTNEKAALTNLVSKSRGTNSAEVNRLQVQVDNMQQMLDAATESKEMATRVLRCEQVKVMTLNIEHDKYKFRSQQLEGELQRQRGEWQRERGEWQKEKAELDQQLEQCAQEIARANDTWVSNANSIHKLTADGAALKTENAGLKTVNAGLKTVNGGLTAEMAELASENAELKADNAGLKTENAQLKTGGAWAKTVIASLTSDMAVRESENVRLRSENAALTSENAKLKSESVKLKSESVWQRDENAELVSDNAVLKTEIIGLRAETRPTGDGATSEGDEGINSLDLSATVRIMDAQNRRANLEIRLAEQVADEEALLARRDDLDRELAECDGAAARLRREAGTDRTSLALIARKMQDAQEQILRDDRAMSSSEEDSLVAEERLQRMSKRSHELEGRIAAADAHAHDLAQMARVLQEERGDLIGRLVRAAEAKEALAKEAEGMREAEAEDLRRRLDMAATEYRKVYVQMRRAERRLAKMKQKQSLGEGRNVAEAGYVCPTCSAAFPFPAKTIFLAHLEDHLS